MADVRKREGVENPCSQRELIGTLKYVELPKKENGQVVPGKVTPGYFASLQLNASEDRTKIASQANPEGGRDLNLNSYKYEREVPGVDGAAPTKETRIGHNCFYSKEQGDAMIAAAGKNVAPHVDSAGKKIADTKVIAFKADLVPSKYNPGLVVNTAHEMKSSEIASFGKSGKKAREAMTAQYDSMRECGERYKAAQSENTRSVETPDMVAPEASAEMEAGVFN